MNGGLCWLLIFADFSCDLLSFWLLFGSSSCARRLHFHFPISMPTLRMSSEDEGEEIGKSRSRGKRRRKRRRGRSKEGRGGRDRVCLGRSRGERGSGMQWERRVKSRGQPAAVRRRRPGPLPHL